MGVAKKNKWPELKTCERCKETDIKFWADVCKHCGKDPDGAESRQQSTDLGEGSGEAHAVNVAVAP